MAVTYSPAVTDTDFANEVEQHEGVTMVDFWAAWCGPCQIIAPIVEEIAEEYDGKVKVTKLDVDANQNTAARFDVSSIPSVILLNYFSLFDTVVGVVPKAHLVEKIEQHLG